MNNGFNIGQSGSESKKECRHERQVQRDHDQTSSGKERKDCGIARLFSLGALAARGLDFPSEYDAALSVSDPISTSRIRESGDRQW